MTPHEPWLSARELAPRIGVSLTTVRRLGDSLPRTLVGGQYRYYVSEVEAALPRNELESRSDCLYFLRETSTGCIKIGRSWTPEHRAKSIINSMPVEIELLRVIKDAGPREEELHKRFAEYRVRGEWFMPCPDLEAIVESGEL